MVLTVVSDSSGETAAGTSMSVSTLMVGCDDDMIVTPLAREGKAGRGRSHSGKKLDMLSIILLHM